MALRHSISKSFVLGLILLSHSSAAWAEGRAQFLCFDSTKNLITAKPQCAKSENVLKAVVNLQNVVTSFIPVFGVKGAQGEIGDQGAPGFPGPVGLQGPHGQQGIKGEKGVLGDVGPKGATGNPGTVGPKGDIGPKGPIGVQGPQGNTGVNGLPSVTDLTQTLASQNFAPNGDSLGEDQRDVTKTCDSGFLAIGGWCETIGGGTAIVNTQSGIYPFGQFQDSDGGTAFVCSWVNSSNSVVSNVTVVTHVLCFPS